MRLLVPGLCATALAAALGATTFAATAANGSDTSSTSSSADETLRFRSESVTFEFFDVGDKGQSVGDHFVFSDKVVERGRTVGAVDGDCTFTRTPTDHSQWMQCVATATLRHGHITFQGVLRITPDAGDTFPIAVTGGTGAYDEAAGDAEFRFTPDGATVYTVHLDG